MTSLSDFLPDGALRLGFGCGDLSAGSSTAASVRLVEAALDAGFRWFDAARLYGDGRAEEILGRVLPRVRDRVVIVSKAGILPWRMQLGARLRIKAARTARAAVPLARRFTPEPPPAEALWGAFGADQLRRSVERSLKALRTDHLDILLLHECGLDDVRRPETMEFLERLRRDGKVRLFGIATQFPETLAILQQAPEAAAGMAQFASDAFNRNVSALPAGWRGLVGVHTVLRHALPRLNHGLDTDPAARARWTELTGLSPQDRSGAAGLLLADALARNVNGVVLVSSTRPERFAEAAEAARRVDDPRALTGLRQVIDGGADWGTDWGASAPSGVPPRPDLLPVGK
jgi:D-threo-aldose 1-dehydrogenase